MTTVDESVDGRGRRVLAACARWARRAQAAAPAPIRWFLDSPARLTTLAWLIALLVVGLERMALADDIIVGPDLAHGGPKTLYENFDLWAYQLTVKPDDENSDWLGVSQSMLEVVGLINYLLLWACLGLLYGGLTLLEWLLNLHVYQDSAGQIDSAVRMVADHVFWPLIGATAATGAVIAYARWRGEGRGFVSDMLWVLVTVLLGIGFASGPSTVAGEVDAARQQLASGVIAGATDYVDTAHNPVGYPSPQLSGNPQEIGTRKLVDGLWSTFGATPWCFAEFRDLSICRNAGTHALANDATWQGWMAELDNNGSPAVFGNKSDYVRGQDMTRTGVLLLMVLVTVPLAVMLVRLVIAGLTAAVGFLLMLVVGMLFLTFLPIEGWFRRVGIQYVTATFGMALVNLVVTLVIAALMVTSTIISSLAASYGFFVAAVLNLAAMVAAMKAKAWIDAVTTFSGGSSGGLATALIARSVMRTVVKAVGGVASGGIAAAAGFAGGFRRDRDSLGGAWRNVQPRSGGLRNWTRLTSLDSGPLRGRAHRMRQPGNEPRLGGGGAALPAGATRNTTSGAGATPSSSTATATAHSGGDRTPPIAAQGGGRPSAAAARTVTPESVEDGRLHRNVAAAQQRSGHRGRVWVAHPGGRGVAPLDTTSSPREARPQRGGVYRVTDATPRPRRGWFGRN